VGTGKKRVFATVFSHISKSENPVPKIVMELEYINVILDNLRKNKERRESTT